MDSRDELIAKIKKLLDLSTWEGTNEHVAAEASRKVQELLQKYNLDEEEVKGYRGKSSIVLVEIEYLTHIKWSKIWEVRLADLLSQAYFTKTIFNQYSIWFIGRSLDTEITRDVFVRVRKYLHDLSLQRLAEYGQAVRESFKELQGEFVEIDLRRLGKGYRSQEYRRGWLQGSLEGVAFKTQNQRRRFENQVSKETSLTGRELIVLRGKEIEESEFFPKVPPVTLPDIGDHELGRRKGILDGSQSSLHRADLEQRGE